MEFVVKQEFSKTGVEIWLNQNKERIIEWQVLPAPEKYEYIIIAKLRKEEN